MCLGCLLLASCSQLDRVGPPSEALPEMINYTPFPSTLLVGEFEDRRFFSTVMKASMKIFPDGSLKFDPDQESLSKAYSYDPSCPGLPVTVDDHVMFRVRAEIFLRPGRARFDENAYVEIDGHRKAVNLDGDCARLSDRTDLFLVPYLDDGTTITVHGIRGVGELRFVIPADMMPHVLLRYQAGQLVPIPARLDTVTIEPDNRRLVLVYRSTFPVEPAIRRFELRAVLPPAIAGPTGNEAPEARRRRNQATLRFLRRCPVPALPIEPCARPDIRVDRAIFGL